MISKDVLYWIWLARALGVASKNFVRLIERFIDPYEIYSLEPEEIERIEGIGEKTKNALCNKNLEESYSVLRYCKKEKIDIVVYSDKRYPSRLRTLEDPPVLLFSKGRFPDFNSRLCIAVVGTRKMSEYGKRTSYKIAYEMAAANVLVVSGMARGVDGVSACAALSALGETVAVLGNGIDITYPKEHKKLREGIEKRGAVISEFMPSTPPEKWNFPIRNRIISGLCQGTVVIEGDKRSGALITAKEAIKQGREVFALPGNVDEINSDGTNELIRDGANVALCCDDIIKHYDFLYHNVINYRGLKKAKQNSDYNESAVRSLEVSARVYRVDIVKNESALSQQSESEKKETSAIQNVSRTETVKKENEKPREDTNEVLSLLDDAAKRVFGEMPIDLAVSPDALVSGTLGIGDVITALTMLELYGLVVSLPGGLYMRK